MRTDQHAQRGSCRDVVHEQVQLVQALKPAIEEMIDRYGLVSVLQALREVCYDKASHIAVEWQDLPLSKAWLAAGLYVNSAVQKTTV